MKWDGNLLSEFVKDVLYSLFGFEDRTRSYIENAYQMDNKEYAALLKRKHTYSGKSFKNCYASTIPNGITICFLKPIPKELDGDNTIEISWTMAARHIRAWEFEKKREKPQSKIQQQWDETHLCGNYHGKHCEYLIQAKNDTVLNGKKLDSWCPYCTSENKVRKIGSAGSWTGISPKFCPKRKALENKEDNMARKFQFDSAITADMKRASDDSFADNIKMIDISEITPSSENFYEIGSLELLADDIEREGLKHNLVVVKDGSKYRVKSGHRRLAAIKLLIEQKRRSNTKVPCYVDGSKSEAEAQFDLIMLNATQRKYSDADILHEYEEIERTFKALEAEGKPLKGRIRDNIAAALKVSSAQIGKIENIKHNAIPEVEQAVKSGAMSISTANEVAKLSEDTQKEIIEKQPEITNKEIKALQEEKTKTETKKSAAKPEKEIPSPAQIVSDNEEENIFDIEDDDTDDETENEDCDTYSTNNNPVDETSSLSYTFSLSYNQADKLLEFLTNEGAEQTYPQLETVIYKLKTMLGKLS